MSSVTFDVSDVAPGKLARALDTEASVRSLLGSRVEALHCAAARLVVCDTTHPLAKAACDAFYGHLRLVLRPDDVWFCIAQGFAAHVNQDVEGLRQRFVRHDGRMRLVVNRPDFMLGQPNPWPEVFEEFSRQIGEHVGKLGALVQARFSTSTATEIAAFDVALMDAFQGYFEYEMLLGCGIPKITLLGTPEDWASMIPRVKHLSEYGLGEWCDALLPVLDNLVQTASGTIDREFWRSFFRYQSGSGPAELTGWILTLFPYLVANWETKELRPNPYLTSWRQRFEIADNRTEHFLRTVQGPSIDAIPTGLVSAPVTCADQSTGITHALRFVAGMFGVEQDETSLALAPAFGWAIVYEDAPT